MQEKDFSKIEVKNNICINVFGHENRFGYEKKLVFPIYVSDQKFEDSMDLLLLIDNDKSHYVLIKNVDRFMFHKTKNGFVDRQNCLSVNGKQPVKLEEGITEFENFFKQIPVPFKIDADFECNLRSVEKAMKKKISRSRSLSFVFKVACIDNRFTMPLVVYMLLMNLLKQFFRNINIAEK